MAAARDLCQAGANVSRRSIPTSSQGTLIAATNDDFDDGFDGEADVSFAAVTASLLGIVPVDDTFELYAKIGGYLGESEVDDNFFFSAATVATKTKAAGYGAAALFSTSAAASSSQSGSTTSDSIPMHSMIFGRSAADSNTISECCCEYH